MAFPSPDPDNSIVGWVRSDPQKPVTKADVEFVIKVLEGSTQPILDGYRVIESVLEVSKCVEIFKENKEISSVRQERS